MWWGLLWWVWAAEGAAAPAYTRGTHVDAGRMRGSRGEAGGMWHWEGKMGGGNVRAELGGQGGWERGSGAVYGVTSSVNKCTTLAHENIRDAYAYKQIFARARATPGLNSTAPYPKN